MAGSLKPVTYIENGQEKDIKLSGEEGTIENGIFVPINLVMYASSYGSVEKLFDGNLPTGYSNCCIMLHSKSMFNRDFYLEFKLTKSCSIYGINNTFYNSSILPFAVYEVKPDNTEKLVYAMNETRIIMGKWYLIARKLKANVNYRLRAYGDGHSGCLTELYCDLNNQLLIKKDNKIYSIKDEFYNTDTQMYDEINDANIKVNGFYISELFEEKNINNEVFRPIDKFDNFRFIGADPFSINISGLKNQKEMIISTQNLSLLSANRINTFKQVISKVENGNCKTVFSLDNGVSWKSYYENSIIDLTNSITIDDNLDPDNLSEENKTKWNNLQDEIYEKGMDADTIQQLDFNELFKTYKNIRFAHVLYRPTHNDKITLQNLSWNIDENGDYMVTNDIDIKVNSNKLTAISKEDVQNVKINLLI